MEAQKIFCGSRKRVIEQHVLGLGGDSCNNQVGGSINRIKINIRFFEII